MRSLNPEVSAEFEDFILQLLARNPKNRLSVQEIKSHPWYTAKTSSYKGAVTELNEALMRAYKVSH